MEKPTHPIIAGISSYYDLLAKAKRELARLREHPERPDSDDHAQNCASAINEAVDWLYDRELKGRADWGHPRKDDIVDWLNARSPDLGRILTYNVARKHPRLKPEHNRQIDQATHSVTGGASVQVSISVLKLKSDTANVRFVDAATEVLNVLECLDPQKGRDQK